MSKIWTQLKPRLEMFSKPFPQAAIDLANAHREEVAPYLIACIEAIAADPSPTQNPDYMLHLYAMHLLASWRDTRAYRPLVRLGQQPEEVIDVMLGDVVHESYGRAMASVCDGDLQPLKTLVEDVGACLWSRQAALEAMTVRALEGDADRAAVIAYLAALGDHEAARLGALEGNVAELELLDWIVSSATDIGAVAMLPTIRQWFADKLLDETIADEPWVSANIACSPAECLARLRSHDNSYISDVAREMSWWYCFKDDEAPTLSGSAIPMKRGVLDRMSVFDGESARGFAAAPETFVRETPKIGRNDPCHCGSGLKYKKCHGAPV